jgi:hypothetical protein
LLRKLVIFTLAALAAAAALLVAAGRGAAPTIEIVRPDRARPIVGPAGTLEVLVGAPGGRLETLEIVVEQDGSTRPLFSLASPESATVTQAGDDQVRVVRPFGSQAIPTLKAGPARVTVTASRSSFLSLRTLTASDTQEIQVRLEPPRVSISSTHHYVNHGGAEMVVYQVTPADVDSGVRVGDIEYRGYPAAGLGVTGADDRTRVAFFALLPDQDLKTPIVVFARDGTGNEATASFVERVFPKPFRRSRIDLDDAFLERVVHEILTHAPELGPPPRGSDLVPAFLRINGDLRRMNAERLLVLAEHTTPARLWSGPFLALSKSQVEASFADQRTYLYKGKEVDRQVHLGFDLASTATTPVAAANAGTVVLADWLGIYGNCVVIDHGMGLASLYGHLSVLDVRQGQSVTRGQQLGRTGMTGLAAGDHLHFTMLVGGRPVDPREWWDAHWIEDRIDRKLRDGALGSREAR